MRPAYAKARWTAPSGRGRRTILMSFSKKFGGQWKVLCRLHPNISDLKIGIDNRYCIDVTMYPDIQEIMLIADICISDYSSVAFEFAVTGKPSFLYVPDYEEYKVNRGLDYPLEKTSFPIAENQEELCANIEGFMEKEYEQKSKEFYENFIGMYKEGNAAEYLADRIIDKCK